MSHLAGDEVVFNGIRTMENGDEYVKKLRDVINSSPTLLMEINDYINQFPESAFKVGVFGKGTFFNGTDIIIDPKDFTARSTDPTDPKNLGLIAGTLAHELGHFEYSLQHSPLSGPDGFTEDMTSEAVADVYNYRASMETACSDVPIEFRASAGLSFSLAAEDNGSNPTAWTDILPVNAMQEVAWNYHLFYQASVQKDANSTYLGYYLDGAYPSYLSITYRSADGRTSKEPSTLCTDDWRHDNITGATIVFNNATSLTINMGGQTGKDNGYFEAITRNTRGEVVSQTIRVIADDGGVDQKEWKNNPSNLFQRTLTETIFHPGSHTETIAYSSYLETDVLYDTDTVSLDASGNATYSTWKSGVQTQKWTDARLGMLKYAYTLRNAQATTSRTPYTDLTNSNAVYYEDQLTGKSLYINTPGLLSDRQHIIFGADGHTLAGGDQADLLFAGPGNETLDGGAGDDYLEAGPSNNSTTGPGNDVLKGGKGNDTYEFAGFSTQCSGVTEHIDDTDGQGSIWVGDAQLTGTGPLNAIGNLTWKDGDGVTYQFTPASSDKAIGSLTIKLPNTDNQIVIDNFDLNRAQSHDGYLGIHLGQEKISLLQGLAKSAKDYLNWLYNDIFGGSGSTSNTAAGIAGGAAGSLNTPATLAEGALQMVTAFVTAASDQAQTVTLNLTGGSGNAYAINTGADLIPFNGGNITLTVPAGQDSVTFALVNTGDITQNENLQLTATLANGSFTTRASNDGHYRVAA